MKKLTILLFATMFLTSFLFVEAQSKCININNTIVEHIGRQGEKNIDQITGYWDTQDSVDKVVKEDTLILKTRQPIDITDSETDSNANTFSGDKVIGALDTIRSNVVVKGGNLTIFGMVDGNVLVMGGNLSLKSTGRINGDASVIDGNILKEDGAIIRGYENKTSTEKITYRPTRKKFSRSGRTFDVPWQEEQTNLDKFVFRYNRVESLFLGFGTEKKFYWDGRRKWNAYGFLGWGFKSHTWRGNLGLSRQFAVPTDKGSSIVEVGTDIYSLTDTKDQWIIFLHENTAAALLIHEDFRDYFERNGYTLHMAYYSIYDYLKVELRLAYIIDSYESLSNHVDWALFGGRKKFRENPSITPGDINSMKIQGGVSTITKTSFGTEGWSLYGSAEFAEHIVDSIQPGNINFEQYIFDLRRFQPLGKYENFNIRLRVGSADGPLPPQKMYELGGLGTMNAFPFKSEIGNRMMLINMEFIVNGNILDDLAFWPTWIFEHINIMLISDAGFTRNVSLDVSATRGFGNIKWNEFKHNFGVALSNRSGSLRIGFAWRTDYPAPAQFLLRFGRPF